MRNRVHYLILFLLLSLPALAQENFSWSGIAGTIIEKNVSLNDSWTGTPTAQAYYRPGGSLIPGSQQPVVTKIADKLYVRFNATKSMAERTYIVISTGATVRYTGYLTLTIGTIPPPATGGGTGTVTVAGVQGLAGALNERVAVTAYQQDRDALVNLINGRATSQQVNAIQQTATAASSRVTSLSNVIATRVQTPSQVRAMNAINTLVTPDVIDVKGPTGGTFELDATDTSTPDNGGVVLVTSNGLRYKRRLPDKRVTPDMFGAIPNDNGDDGAALQAWLSLTGTYELFLPAGTYRSSIQLLRTNMGAISVIGAGSARSKIVFTANTNGIGIVNPLNGNYGSLSVRGFELISMGTKTAGTEALRVSSQHEQRPGVVIDDISIKCLTIGQEWSTGIRVHDCSGTYITNVDIQGASLTATTGISITNNPSRPAVEHMIINPRMRAVNEAFGIVGAGYPAVEGVKILGGEIASCSRGVYATTPGYGAPEIQILGLHIFSFGKECLYIDSFQQVTLMGCVLYADKRSDGLIPSRAVYFNNSIDLQGTIKIVCRDNIPYAVEFAGTGGMNELLFTLTTFSAQTKLAKVDSAGYANDPPYFGRPKRTWTNNTTWGSTNPHPDVYVDGPYRLAPSADNSGLYPADGKYLRFSQGAYRAVSLATSYTTAQIATGGVPMTAGLVIVHNETLPAGSCSPGDLITVSRVGGEGTMAPEIAISARCVEANKARIYFHNTASTTKTLIESQFTLKVTKL